MNEAIASGNLRHANGFVSKATGNPTSWIYVIIMKIGWPGRKTPRDGV